MVKYIIGFLRQGLQKVTFSWLLLAVVVWVIILVAVILTAARGAKVISK